MSTWDESATEDLVRKPSVTYLLNDLRYALTNTATDVEFRVFRSVQKSCKNLDKSTKIAKSTNDDEDPHDVSVVVPLHSSVLLARLPWFRENYNDLKDNTIKVDVPENDDQKMDPDAVIEKAEFDGKKFTIVLIKADREKDTGVDPNTVYEFVKFVYSAQCKISPDTVNGLLRLAKKFHFDSLIEKIEEYFINKLNKNEYDLKKQIELLKISDHHELEKVKDKTKTLIKANDNATTSPAWKKLLNDNPKLLSEIYQD